MTWDDDSNFPPGYFLFFNQQYKYEVNIINTVKPFKVA